MESQGEKHSQRWREEKMLDKIVILPPARWTWSKKTTMKDPLRTGNNAQGEKKRNQNETKN